MYKRLAILVTLALMLFPAPAELMAAQAGSWKKKVAALARSGAVLVTTPQGRDILALHADKKLMPASTLKIVTAAAAFDSLGPDFRFQTDFYLTAEKDLYIKGFGDPYLVSEELEILTRQLKAQGLARVRHIILDNAYFTPDLVLDGTNRSLNPYDAYNGALCVNFNTIHVYISKKGQVSSAEPQTPLTDMARSLALKSGQRGKTRFNLADDPKTCLLYAGELTKVFLKKAGVRVSGKITPARKFPQGLTLYYRHRSRHTLSWLVSRLFKYSNNFMTNQVFLAMGAKTFGPPATAEKARKTVARYLAARKIPPFHMEEGSGLSRLNRLTARQLNAVLHEFKPYRQLLTEENRALYKTGSLRDVKSMVGYIRPLKGEPYNFVIMLNGSPARFKVRARILELLEENLK